MKSKFAKVRSMAGLFLEALMLVFLFAYAQGDLAAERSEAAGEPLSEMVLNCAIAVPTSSVSQAFHSTPPQIPFQDQVILPAGLQGICVALSRALYISRFERDTFYIASADAIP
jgi:hypothetical protein